MMHTRACARMFGLGRRAMSTTPKSLNVGVLGCTGVVGQRFLQLLEHHPYMNVTTLGASARSAGNQYKDIAAWKLDTEIPARNATQMVHLADPEHFQDVDLVFSALDTAPALAIEDAFAKQGIPVFSNASAYRMHPTVPILIPDVNAPHVDSVTTQAKANGWKEGGYIITNANCSTTGLTIALKPLLDTFGIKKAMVVTMQAISGAGYPGCSAMDLLDNLVPHIGGEEPKMESEALKIFGEFKDGAFVDSPGPIVSAMCNRVSVVNGHTLCVSLEFEKEGVTPAMVSEALSTYRSPVQLMGLPSGPAVPIHVIDSLDRPQPRLDRDRGGGFTATVGGVRDCKLFDVKFSCMSHNTVIGAAGGSILNAELAVAKGLLGVRK